MRRYDPYVAVGYRIALVDEIEETDVYLCPHVRRPSDRTEYVRYIPSPKVAADRVGFRSSHELQ